MSLKFEIVNFRLGTDNQRANNFHASCSLEVFVDNHLVVRLHDLSLKMSKSGEMFVAPPSRSYKSADGETKWLNFFQIFPEDRESSDKLSKVILAKFKEEGGDAHSAPKPRSRPEKTAPAAKDSDMDSFF